MTITVILTNDFHGTSATLRLPENGDLVTSSQQRRAEKKLCGMQDCQCGILRGRQEGLPPGWKITEGCEADPYRWWIGPL